MNTFDIIILAIIGVCLLNGLIRGFIKTLFGLTSLLIAVILTWLLTPVISDMVVTETSFDEMISEQVVELLGIEDMMNQAVDTTATTATEALRNLSLPGNIIDALVENYTPQIVENLNVSSIGDYVGGAISLMAVKALVYLVLFLIITLTLNAIATILDLVARLPVLKQINRFGGFLLGLLVGVVIVWVGCLCLSFVIAIQATPTLSAWIEASIFGKLFYYNNPLQHFIMNLDQYAAAILAS